MKIKALIDEDFINYKKPSMFIGTISCNWKCCKEQNLDVSMCQNSALAQSKTIEISNNEIINRYQNNPITQAIVFGGLEPFDQYQEILTLIKDFRKKGINDDIVIYTGYEKEEIGMSKLEELRTFNNIIIKFGRYIPNTAKIYDSVLGITLASSNQHAEKLN